MLFFKLALRNILRNRRRSLINITMILGCFTALVLNAGFIKYLLDNLEYSTTNSIYGHIQIARDVFWEKKQVDVMSDRLFAPSGDLIEKIKKIDGIKSVSARNSFFGLLASGDKTTAGRAVALDPVQENSFFETVKVMKGGLLDGKNPYSIMIGEGLAKTLEASVGSTITIVGQTVDGAANAIDVDLVGVFNTGVQEFDDVTFIIPIQASNKLLDSELVERLIIKLDDKNKLVSTQTQVDQLISGNDDLKTKQWVELADLFRKSKGFLETQNTVIQTIIAFLVLLGITNIIGMSIIERMKEIGTARAMGDSRFDIVKQFALEGFMLALVSLLVAIPFSIAVSLLVEAAQIEIQIPGASMSMILAFNTSVETYFQSALVVLITTVLATLMPAVRAAYIPIVEALR